MKMKKFWNIVDLCVVCPSLQTSNSLMSSAEIGTLQTWTDKILKRFRRRSWNLHCFGAKLSLKTFLLNLFFFFQVCMKLPSRIGTGRSIARTCTPCFWFCPASTQHYFTDLQSESPDSTQLSFQVASLLVLTRHPTFNVRLGVELRALGSHVLQAAKVCYNVTYICLLRTLQWRALL